MTLKRGLAIGLVILTFGLVWIRFPIGDDALATQTQVVLKMGASAAVVAHRDASGATTIQTFGGLDELELSPGSRFRLASLTKPVISAAIFELVAQGSLSLEDRVADLLDELAFADPLAKEIRLRDLLRHSAGFDETGGRAPLFLNAETLKETFDLDEEAQTDCKGIAAAMAALPLEFAPGTNAQYSNTGYCLLGLVIERVSGRPLERALHDLVPEARGLTLNLDALDVRVAVPQRQQQYLVLKPDVVAGAGGLIGAVDDYLAFMKRPVADEVAAPVPYPYEGESYLGLGWRIWPDARCPVRTHFGAMPSVFSVAVVAKDGQSLVALFAGRPDTDWPAFMAMVDAACAVFGDPR